MRNNYKYEIDFKKGKELVDEYLIELRENKNRYKFRNELFNFDYLELLKNSNIFKNQFSDFKYSIKDLDAIIYNKDVETLQNVNPLLFNCYYRTAMSIEMQIFFANNISWKQMQYFSRMVIRKLDFSAIEILYNRFRLIDKDYYILYSIDDKELGVRNLIFTTVNTIDEFITDLYKKAKRKNKNKGGRAEKAGFNFDNKRYKELGITFTEMCRYLKIEKNTLFILLKDINSAFSRFKKAENEVKSLEKFYNFEGFKKTVESIYVPSKNDNSKDRNLFPSEGLLKAEQLAADYRDIDKRILYYAANMGEIGYYKVSQRNLRFSQVDFDNFVEKRIREGMIFHKKPTTCDLKADNDKYISAQELTTFIYPWYKDKDDIDYKYSEKLQFYTVMRKHCTTYNDEYGNKYYKVEEVNKFISDNYGIMKDGKFTHVANNFTYDTLGEVYVKNKLYEALQLKYPSITKFSLKTRFLEAYTNGKLPVVRITDRILIIRKDDLVKVKEILMILV